MDLKTLQDTPPWEWPKDAGKTFQKILADPRADKSDRLIAADLAGDPVVINNQLADALMAVVREPGEPERLRATAAIALGPVLELADTDGFEDPEDVPISERTFRRIQDLFQKIYSDTGVPKELRRRILEASVRATADWHKDAIAAAYASGDKEWMLTAVFSMRHVRGFDEQILEALKSDDPETHRLAIEAAGNWEVAAAWPHVVAIVQDPGADKELLLAAIDAVGTIRPSEAPDILANLADSDDEEIAEAAVEAIEMAEAQEDWQDSEDDDETGEEWIN